MPQRALFGNDGKIDTFSRFCVIFRWFIVNVRIHQRDMGTFPPCLMLEWNYTTMFMREYGIWTYCFITRSLISYRIYLNRVHIKQGRQMDFCNYFTEKNIYDFIWQPPSVVVCYTYWPWALRFRVHNPTKKSYSFLSCWIFISICDSVGVEVTSTCLSLYVFLYTLPLELIIPVSNAYLLSLAEKRQQVYITVAKQY